MKQYEETATTNYQPSGVVESGSHLHSFDRQVVIPATNALIPGAVAGVLVLIAGIFYWRDTAALWAIIAFVVAYFSWWLLERLDLRNLTARIELMTGVNLDDDPRIGNNLEPERQSILIDERTITADGQDITRRGMEIRISPEKLRIYAPAIVSGKATMAQGEWVGKGKLFGQTEYENFIADMLKYEYATVKNEKKVNAAGKNISGHEPTPHGMTWLRKNCPPRVDLPDGFTRM